MSKQVKWRRGTTAEHSTFIGAIGEVTVDTTKNTVVVHDGLTLGGHSAELTEKPASTVSKEGGGSVQGFIDGFTPNDSTQLVGGVSASYLNFLSKKNGVDDYTIINPDVQKVASNIMSATQTLKCVVTGDSLGLNGFGYTGFPVAGAGYATDQPFGLSSWSYLLRDFWFTSAAGFTGVQNLKLTGNASTFYATSEANAKNIGMNAKAIFYNFSTVSNSMSVQTNYSGQTYLVISYAPNSEAVLFNVDGIEYDNESPTGNYQGYGYMLVPTTATSAVVTNVRKKVGGGAGGFWLYGVNSIGAVEPKITAKGGYNSAQVLAEFATLVTPYSPNVIFYIIGANDINQSVPLADFKNNVQGFIDAARLADPDCVIVLLSSVPSSTPSIGRAKSKTYIKEMYDLAVLNSCSLIDMYSKLENIDTAYWRFDNIHFKRRGDDIVFGIVKSLILDSVPVDVEKFYPSRETYLGINGKFMNSRFSEQFEKAQSVVVQFVAGAPVVVTSGSSSTAFANSLIMSYLTDGASDKCRIQCPQTHAIGAISDIIIGTDFTERVVGRLVVNKYTTEFARVNSVGRQTIAGSNLYTVINFVPV